MQSSVADTLATVTDTTGHPSAIHATPAVTAIADSTESAAAVTSGREASTSPFRGPGGSLSASASLSASRFPDVSPRTMLADHPFKVEAQKVLSGRLEETDSVNRHKILSYCEHLRTSYTTRDIDFIRQVFSDNALIIVGHVVRTGESVAAGNYSDKVQYSFRSKKSYLERLAKIFDSGKEIDVRFSGFRIMRHPTVKGIYGVTLRQKYSCGGYSDDGYLFLLWDFRNVSMPQIHVRTWQPSLPIANGDDEVIDISDFNLE
ncbi:MAG: hypothetical protein K2K77_06860 [Duncaniella sp.]|nr:hypothetical protein [Duncaniella sp.]